LIELLQYRVSLLIDSIQEVSYVSTLPTTRQAEYASHLPRVVWDPGIIFSFSLVQSMGHLVVMVLLEDKKSLGREDCDVPIFGFPYFAVGGDLQVYASLTRGLNGG
jgi:hypothetical protein